MRKIDELNKYIAKYPDVSPVLLFKISLTKYGAVFSDRCLARLQERDYRFTKAEPFGIKLDIRNRDFYTPGPIVFRDGSSVLCNFGEPYESPYLLDYDPENDCFVALEDGELVDVIDFVARPSFFDKTTSRGVPMDHIAGTCSGQRLLINAFQRCRFWEEGTQCHYCALFSAGTVLPEVDLGDVRETVAEAIREPGRFSEISVSGGSDFGGDPPFSNEIERYIRVLGAIGESIGKDYIDLQLMAPAYKKSDLRRIVANTPLTSYKPNVEIWDADTFRALCPGKEKWVGHDEWVRRICDAVEVFGKGQVYTQMVCGAELASNYGLKSAAEAIDSALEGCEFFAKNGVACYEEIWRPHRGEKLGWQQMQDLDYFIKIAVGFHDIHKAYGLTDVDKNFMRGSDNPDSDMERGECCPDIRVEKRVSDIRTAPSDTLLKELPEEVKDAVGNGRRDALVSAGDGEAFALPLVYAPDGFRLLAPIISERSDLSSFLFRKMWFRDPVEMLLPVPGKEDGWLRLTARVYRSHLVGRVFADAFAKAGKVLGEDIAQCAEIRVDGASIITAPRPEVLDSADRYRKPHL